MRDTCKLYPLQEEQLEKLFVAAKMITFTETFRRKQCTLICLKKLVYTARYAQEERAFAKTI